MTSSYISVNIWTILQKFDGCPYVNNASIGSNFVNCIEIPESIEYLAFGWNFSDSIKLPNNISHLVFMNETGMIKLLKKFYKTYAGKTLDHLTCAQLFSKLFSIIRAV